MAESPPKYRSRRPALDHPPLPHRPKPPLELADNLARTFIDSPLSPLLLVATLAIDPLERMMSAIPGGKNRQGPESAGHNPWAHPARRRGAAGQAGQRDGLT